MENRSSLLSIQYRSSISAIIPGEMFTTKNILLCLALGCLGLVSGRPTSRYTASMPVYGSRMSYAQPTYAGKSYSAPAYGHSIYKRSVSYEAPAAAQTYTDPAADYAAPVETYAKIAPKMHYIYEEKNIYVPQTYAAPATYAKATPKMHYNYEEKNIYAAPAATYAAPSASYPAPAEKYPAAQSSYWFRLIHSKLLPFFSAPASIYTALAMSYGAP